MLQAWVDLRRTRKTAERANYVARRGPASGLAYSATTVKLPRELTASLGAPRSPRLRVKTQPADMPERLYRRGGSALVGRAADGRAPVRSRESSWLRVNTMAPASRTRWNSSSLRHTTEACVNIRRQLGNTGSLYLSPAASASLASSAARLWCTSTPTSLGKTTLKQCLKRCWGLREARHDGQR